MNLQELANYIENHGLESAIDNITTDQIEDDTASRLWNLLSKSYKEISLLLPVPNDESDDEWDNDELSFLEDIED